MNRKVKNILIENIEVNSDREEGGSGDISILAASIEHIGLINPITVREKKGFASLGLYTVVAGRRRLQAVKRLGRNVIEAIVYGENEDIRADEIALAENVNRLEMHPLDEGAKFKNLFEKGLSVKELSDLYDRSEAHIYQRMKLCDLTEDLKNLFRDGKINITQAAQAASVPKEVQEGIYKDTEGGRYTYPSVIRGSISRHVKSFLYFESWKCKDCTKRTRYGDCNLFPELSGATDYCFDVECYKQREAKAFGVCILNFVRKEQITGEVYINLNNFCGSGEEVNELFERIKETSEARGIHLKSLKDDDDEIKVLNKYEEDALKSGVIKGAAKAERLPVLSFCIRSGRLECEEKQVLKKEDYEQLFPEEEKKERQLSEEEEGILKMLPEEYIDRARNDLFTRGQLSYEHTEAVTLNAAGVFLKKQLQKPRSLLIENEDFSEYLEEYFEPYLGEAFSLMTGAVLTDLKKDAARFNFDGRDYSNLFMSAFILKKIGVEVSLFSGAQAAVEELAQFLGADIKETEKIFNEELKKYVKGRYKKEGAGGESCDGEESPAGGSGFEDEEDFPEDGYPDDDFPEAAQAENGSAEGCSSEEIAEQAEVFEDDEAVDIEPFRRERFCSF